MDFTENSILEAIKRKEENSIQNLFKQIYRPLVMYAYQYLNSLEDAEDLVQDVFVKVCDSSALDKLDGKLYAYLYTSVRNASINLLKKKKLKHIVERDNLLNKDDNLNIDEIIWGKYINKIYEEVEKLPSKTKIIFKSIVFEEKSYKNVALDLNISVNTVKKSLSRAFTKLRSQLGKDEFMLFILCYFWCKT